jgi:hypothetical protein
MLNQLGKTLILFGLILVAVGIILTLAGRIPFLGRLPGDIYVQKKNFTFYFPITTSILLSILLSALLYLISRR